MATPPEEHFDWDKYEADVSRAGDGNVVDLDAARVRREDLDDADTVDEADGPVLVDSVAAQRRPRFTLSGLRDATRRPIVPGWLRSGAEFTGNLFWALGLAGHSIGYHGFRLPKYAAKVAWRAPRGVGRIVTGYARWLFDMEGEVYRQACARTEDREMYLKLSRQRDRRVRWRGIVTVPLLVLLTTAAVYVWLASSPVQLSALALLAAVCGIVGTPAGKPLLDTAIVRTDAAPLTSDEVVRALATLRQAVVSRADQPRERHRLAGRGRATPRGHRNRGGREARRVGVRTRSPARLRVAGSERRGSPRTPRAVRCRPGHVQGQAEALAAAHLGHR
jgi:S-DNA-T family DNA segregation ATPase FtsK/SpoIIIE